MLRMSPQIMTERRSAPCMPPRDDPRCHIGSSTHSDQIQDIQPECALPPSIYGTEWDGPPKSSTGAKIHPRWNLPSRATIRAAEAGYCTQTEHSFPGARRISPTRTVLSSHPPSWEIASAISSGSTVRATAAVLAKRDARHRGPFFPFFFFLGAYFSGTPLLSDETGLTEARALPVSSAFPRWITEESPGRSAPREEEAPTLLAATLAYSPASGSQVRRESLPTLVTVSNSSAESDTTTRRRFLARAPTASFFFFPGSDFSSFRRGRNRSIPSWRTGPS